MLRLVAPQPAPVAALQPAADGSTALQLSAAQQAALAAGVAEGLPAIELSARAATALLRFVGITLEATAHARGAASNGADTAAGGAMGCIEACGAQGDSAPAPGSAHSTGAPAGTAAMQHSSRFPESAADAATAAAVDALFEDAAEGGAAGSHDRAAKGTHDKGVAADVAASASDTAPAHDGTGPHQHHHDGSNEADHQVDDDGADLQWEEDALEAGGAAVHGGAAGRAQSGGDAALREHALALLGFDVADLADGTPHDDAHGEGAGMQEGAHAAAQPRGTAALNLRRLPRKARAAVLQGLWCALLLSGTLQDRRRVRKT